MEKNIKIFLVDDDAFCLHLYEQNLKNLGYADISTFTNGTNCLDALVDDPEIIFLDYNLDDLNGLEVLKKIKRFNPNIYVVMVSAQKKVAVGVETLKYGAFDYIVKNESISEQMENVINKIISIRQYLENKNNPAPPRIFTLAGLFLIVFILTSVIYKFIYQ